MKGPMLWGAVAVSIVALLGFITVSVLAFTGPIPADLKAQLVSIVTTGWLGMATTAVGFWVGSSISSMRKTELLKGDG